MKKKTPFDLGRTRVVPLIVLLLAPPVVAAPPSRSQVVVANVSDRALNKLVLSDNQASAGDLIAGHTSHRSHSSHSSHSSHYSGSGSRSSSPTLPGFPYYSTPRENPESGGGFTPSVRTPSNSWKYSGPKKTNTLSNVTGGGFFDLEATPQIVTDKEFGIFEFDRYINEHLTVKDDDGNIRSFYLPDRVGSVHKLDRWETGARVGISSYPSGTSERAISALLPLSTDAALRLAVSGRQLTGLTGWKLKRLDLQNYTLTSPIQPAFIAVSEIEVDALEGLGIRINRQESQSEYHKVADSTQRLKLYRTKDGVGALFIKQPFFGSKPVAVVLSCPLAEIDFYLPIFEFWLRKNFPD